MSVWFCDHAWVDGGAAQNVVIRTEGGQVTVVATGVVGQPEGATCLAWPLALPAFANAPSHAFHRALRGSTHSVDDDDPAALHNAITALMA